MAPPLFMSPQKQTLDIEDISRDQASITELKQHRRCACEETVGYKKRHKGCDNSDRLLQYPNPILLANYRMYTHWSFVPDVIARVKTNSGLQNSHTTNQTSDSAVTDHWQPLLKAHRLLSGKDSWSNVTKQAPTIHISRQTSKCLGNHEWCKDGRPIK